MNKSKEQLKEDLEKKRKTLNNLMNRKFPRTESADKLTLKIIELENTMLKTEWN